MAMKTVARRDHRSRRLPVSRVSLVLVAVLLAAAGCGGPGRQDGSDTARRVAILDLVPSPVADSARDGVLEGLRSSGLAEGKEYIVSFQTAQGDVAVLNTMVDAAIAQGTDLFIAISTITLQTVIQRGNQVPTVFTFVADPETAGAGKSDTDHLPWVTGVYTMSDFPGMVSTIKECLPGARAIGTLFCPAEVNSVFYRDQLEKAAASSGITLISVPAELSTDVPNAAASLCERQLDAVCQISDNLTSVSFPAIATAVQRANLPLFVFQSEQADVGGVIALARDFRDAGHDAGLMAARVLRGESPAGIPFQVARTTTLVVNVEIAHGIGMALPPALIARADRVIR